MKRPLRLFHVFSTFAGGGPQQRAVDILNWLGDACQSTVLSMDGNVAAAALLRAPYELVQGPPKGSLRAALALRRRFQQAPPDLVLTYNWGAIDAVLGTRGTGLPVIHAEDGFGADEAERLKRRRVWMRRWLLNRIEATVVPSRTLERIALEQYRLRPDKVRYIPNGVDCDGLRPNADSARRAALGFAEDDVVFGFVGHLRPEKNLRLLLGALARSGLTSTRLLVVGDGACRRELELAAAELGVAARVRWIGAVADSSPWYGAMDVFVLSSSTEQMPLALLEAMASGLPALCTAVGDCPDILGSDAAPWIVEAGDEPGYAAAMRTLAGSAELRRQAGKRNRERAEKHYGRQPMLEQYRELYWAAAGIRTSIGSH